MDKLPLEIIRENIMPFTYKCQPKELLQDIVSYYEVTKLLNDYYDYLFNRSNTIPYCETEAEKRWVDYVVKHGEGKKNFINKNTENDIYFFIKNNDLNVTVFKRLFFYSENGQGKKIWDNRNLKNSKVSPIAWEVRYGTSDHEWRYGKCSTYDEFVEYRICHDYWKIDFNNNSTIAILTPYERIQLLKYIMDHHNNEIWYIRDYINNYYWFIY